MFFLFLIVILLIISNIHLLELLSPLAQTLHSQCLSLSPIGTADEIAKSLVCAEPIHNESFKNFFFKTSLFHLIVVSKTHFILISTFIIFMFKKFKSKPSRVITLLFSFFFALMCKLEAPLVRSLISMGLEQFNLKFKLKLSTVKILMSSALICLSLNPLWSESLSLLHSVSCALAFAMVQDLKCNNFKKIFYAYLLTIPFLYGWGSIHPIGLIINVILTPLLVLTWIPLAYLVFIFHPLMPIFDFYISVTTTGTQFLLDFVPIPENSFHIESWILWILFWSGAFFKNFKKQFIKQNTSVEAHNPIESPI